ncbi:MAG: EpsG family protein [Bacteroides sp.]|nr:EpsG family protein [Bacteroides sp.]
MYLYIILIFIIGWLLHPIIERKYCKRTADIIFLGLMTTVCLFAMGLRDASVGMDTETYKSFFEDYQRYNWYKIFTEKPTAQGNDTVELGLKILMKLCGELYPNYYFYQVVFSGIYIGLFIYFIYKYTFNVILAFAIFLGGGLFMQTFNIARQMLAIAILAYSMIFLIEKKYILSLLSIAFAYLFHTSSIVALIMFVVYPLRNNKVILYFTPFLMLLFLRLINDIVLPLLLNSFGEQYLRYAMSDFSRPNKGIILKLMWGSNFILSVWALYKKDSSVLRFLAILALVAVACFIIGLSINYADRVGLTFLPALLILYDRFGQTFTKTSWKKLYYNSFTAFYLIYFCYYTLTIGSISYSSIITL